VLWWKGTTVGWLRLQVDSRVGVLQLQRICTMYPSTLVFFFGVVSIKVPTLINLRLFGVRGGNQCMQESDDPFEMRRNCMVQQLRFL
jgi:hypothetical protein